MSPGVLRIGYTDRPSPLAHFDTIVDARRGPEPETPLAPRYFGNAGLEYMERFGAAPQTFAEIAVKARRHAANNPYAVFRDPVSVDEVMSSPHVYGALTRLQCCPPTCGAAAAVVCSEDFARRHGLDTTVRIAAQKMVTDFDTTFDPTDLRRLVGYDLTATAAAEVYEAAGVTPTDIDVVELHDCFTANELITYEALGLTPEGTAEKFILDGQNTYGGQIVTNPSGGLLSKGHPLGATGLAQCSELVWQLRGSAAARQVDGARLALQHNLGLGGACVVTVYERA
jgi:acetyl-CoA acetyltransferase